MSGSDDYNASIIAEFRANEGQVGGPWAGYPVILIHHVGARSGVERVTPLGCFPQPDGSYVVVASNGGSANHPAWYHNVKANPVIRVEFGAELFWVTVHEVRGAARARLWPTLVAEAPQLEDYQQKVERRIPVLALTRGRGVAQVGLGGRTARR
ncbi:nitroreductase family deazaflavin-dependent oxidoreductase [Kribbella sp. NPDC026611]|uniref:nitroreductase family deazaflavin-dependent oxidoreductase n=1 Tax=Kribbella sp. NPDC026611 TaxID=3154911 RepID=UPI0033D4444A